MATVEQRLNGLEDGRNGAFASPLQRSMHIGQHRQARFEEEGHSVSGRNNAYVSISDEDAHEDAHEGSTDGMGAIVFTDEEDSGFFGKSSDIGE